jgi:hypothetical protein
MFSCGKNARFCAVETNLKFGRIEYSFVDSAVHVFKE